MAWNPLRVIRRVAIVVLGIGGIVAILLWLMGVFHDKVQPGTAGSGLPDAPSAPTLTIALIEVPVIEVAVGTIEAMERIRVGSRLLARVVEVRVRASQQVKAGEVLVRLDDRDLSAAQAEAQAALVSAQAARQQAQTDLDRSKQLLARGVAAQDRVDRDGTALRRAVAEVERRVEAHKRSQTQLGFATIRSPSDAVVIDKQVEVGNLVVPGDSLVTLYDRKRLQLVASVRETLASRLKPGDRVRVRLDALGIECEAEIARVVPEAMRQSRSFKVEVTGPCPPGVLSGMFGRLLLPVGTRQEIRVPQLALRRVGQIDLAFVVREDGKLLRRFVRVGRQHGELVVILSGLREGERILAVAPTEASR